MIGARPLGAAALGVWLAGCASQTPPSPVLQSQTPAAYAEAAQSGSPAGGEADLASWWTRFNDPVLSGLVERALAANLDLQQTAARITEARQQEIAAGARARPQVQLDTSAARNRISEHAIPIPPGAGSGSSSGGGAGKPAAAFGLPGSEFSSYRLGVDASWELDLFGGARSAVNAARARRESIEWSRRDLQVALAAEAADHYLTLRSLQRREAVAFEELSRQRALLSIVDARAKAGFVTELEASQQRALVGVAEARAYPLEAQARAEIHALGVLVGEPPEALIDALSPGKAEPLTPPAPPPGLPSDLLRRRPDIRKAERDVAAAAADVGVARADLYPKVTLSAQPALVSTALSNLIEWGSRNYTLSAGLLWPILDGGRLHASLAAANARQTQALIGYRKAVLRGLQDVEDALSRYQADDARRGSLEASLQETRGAERLAQDQYRAGVTTYASVLQVQQAMISGEDDLDRAEAARAQDVVGLYRAMGGGWTDQDLQDGAHEQNVGKETSR